MRKSRAYLSVILFSLLVLPANSLCAQDEPAGAAGGRAVLVVPLHVHILQSETLPEANCTLKDEEIRRIIGKVNGVWKQADVQFEVGEIVRERPAKEEEFRAERGDNPAAPLRTYRMLIPEESRKAEGMHVYYIREFPVNGVYFNSNLAMVKQTARLREVEGGIDEPLPRVTAHELGHALGLPHRQARTNLMASGTTGTSLNETEIERAREVAAKVKGVVTLPAANPASPR